MKKKKKLTGFGKGVSIYLKVLLVIMVIFIIYTIISLTSYEKLQVNNYLDNLFKDIASAAEKEKLSDYFDVNELVVSQYENRIK